MLTGGYGAWGTVGADGEWEAATVALYRKASAGMAVAAGEICVAPLSARSGLMGRHSSSKVTERLEITVRVAGKYTIQAGLLGVYPTKMPFLEGARIFRRRLAGTWA